jgi:hypothetical protein
MGRILEFPGAKCAIRQTDVTRQPERADGLALPRQPTSSIVIAAAECLEAVMAKFEPVIDTLEQRQMRVALRSKMADARLKIRLAQHKALLLDSALDT